MIGVVALALPEWLLIGLGAGLFCSLLIAGLFVAFERWFPARAGEEGPVTTSETRRRSEISRYLDAIGESYDENCRIDGQRVAFYLPHREVAITFDARTYYRLEPTGTVPVLVEHELPGVAIGSRLPFETPDIANADDASTVDPRKAALAVLGVSADADRDEIESAYRRQVKQVHPDHGGSRAEFERLREAYATATERDR